MRNPETKDITRHSNGYDTVPRKTKLPFPAPDSLSRNAVVVTNPDDIYEVVQNKRERQLHLLVRRYVSQILHGCQNPLCSAPTCLSYQKRTAKTPLRRYTALSARTLACFLASESDPEAGLCRNTPVVPFDFEVLNTKHTKAANSPRHEKRDLRTNSDARGNGVVLTGEDRLTRVQNHYNRNLKPTSSPSQDQMPTSPTRPNDEPSKSASKRVPTKDPKNFTQNLFDTVAMRMLEWVPLRHQSHSSTSTSELDSPLDYRDVIVNRISQSKLAFRHGEIDGGVTRSSTNRRKKGGLSEQLDSGSDGRHDESLAVGKMNGIAKPIKSHPRRSSETMPPADAKSIASLTKVQVLEGKRVIVQGANDGLIARISRKQGDDIVSESDDSHSNSDSSIDSSEKSVPRRIVNLDDQIQDVEVYTLQQLTEPLLEDLQELIQTDDNSPSRKSPVHERNLTPIQRPLLDQQTRIQNFVRQSMFYVLKEPKRLNESLDQTFHHDSLANFDPISVFRMCASIYNLQPAEQIHQDLWLGLRNLSGPTGTWSNSQRREGDLGKPKNRRSEHQPVGPSAAPVDHLNDEKAGLFCSFVVYALARWSLPSTIFDVGNHHTDMTDWKEFCDSRSIGQVYASGNMGFSQAILDLVDKFEDEWAMKLVEQLVVVITNRLTLFEISKSQKSKGKLFLSKATRPLNILQYLLRLVGKFHESQHQFLAYEGNFVSSSVLQWIRDLLLRQWDGKPIARRASSVGGAIQILAAMFEDKNNLGLLPSDFHTPLLSNRLDPMEMPVEWLSFRPDNKTLHLLSYSFLFPPDVVVTYFRAINFATMSKSFENATAMYRHVHGMALRPEFIHIQNDAQLFSLLRPQVTSYFVLPVSRTNVLTDTMNQLWRREKRELMRPLKVRMGFAEGEEGIDHGGVQQEFFRIVFAEALNPDFGMFSVNLRTRMTWFQPGTQEPLYKFEMLGILMSLAVYNAVTLPVTFPIAFYRKLLSLKVKKVDHIRDGWPDLTRGLEDLLEWNDGDVGDIFLRTYEFTYEFAGEMVSVDMEKVSDETPWPPRTTSKGKGKAKSTSFDFSSADEALQRYQEDAKDTLQDTKDAPEPVSLGVLTSNDEPEDEDREASLVTNKNRARYVKDYIHWLTDRSIRPQYEAFARGFYTCLDRTALSIFTPEALKSVVEGSQDLDIDGLRGTTKYEDGFTEAHPFILDFWDIVKSFPVEKQKQLLEFVTASERIPVNGVKSIMFVIQRNGDNDQRLPTSMTCFGRLLLPQYSSKEILAEKLDKAIENSKGFGAM